MNVSINIIRQGFDKKRCLVHARACEKGDLILASAQYLDIFGCDHFSGLLSAKSFDNGKTWSDFTEEKTLMPIVENGISTVPCDATPMHHKKTDKIILLGHTTSYKEGDNKPANLGHRTFYSVYDEENQCFGDLRFIEMPAPYTFNCGNGSGQSIELSNGDLLIPVYFKNQAGLYSSATILCGFDGTDIILKEIGSPLSCPFGRGLYEPSLIMHNNTVYMTLRNDSYAYVAQSKNGIVFSPPSLWRLDDGSLLQSYNTQQHWMKLDNELYLVYTRKGADNDHVFRHRAPLFAAKISPEMTVIKDTEIIVAPERGARLGNFGVFSIKNGAAVMAAEWMQPIGCEKYGSNNAVFYTEITP